MTAGLRKLRSDYKEDVERTEKMLTLNNLLVIKICSLNEVYLKEKYNLEDISFCVFRITCLIDNMGIFFYD